MLAGRPPGFWRLARIGVSRLQFAALGFGKSRRAGIRINLFPAEIAPTACDGRPGWYAEIRPLQAGIAGTVSRGCVKQPIWASLPYQDRLASMPQIP